MDLSNYFNYNNKSVTYGLTSELIAFYVKNLLNKEDKNIILVTSNLYDSNKLFNSIKSHVESTLLFPMDDFISSMILAKSPEFELERLNTLDKLNSTHSVVVTNLMG